MPDRLVLAGGVLAGIAAIAFGVLGDDGPSGVDLQEGGPRYVDQDSGAIDVDAIVADDTTVRDEFNTSPYR